MIIYKITNLINNKIYIGQDTKNRPLYLGSGILIKNAVGKYGKHNFKKEILEYCKTQEELNEKEQYWITHFNSTNLNVGYNIALGGSGKLGVFPSETTRLKMGESHKGDKNHMYGKHLPDSQKQIISNCGKKRVGEKNSFFGKTHSEKTKMEISNANSIHLTSELEDEIVNLYKIYGIFKIAKVLNIGKKKVNNVLKKRHVVMRPPCINRRKKL
ncbi:MAG: NUMOD3 domain-containing DNA-binding protein [Candidatus Paceibacterota bacterium]|jgi:group I intron endonuclease